MKLRGLLCVLLFPALLCAAPTELKHPYLLFSREDLPRIRQNLASDEGRQLLTRMKEQLRIARENGFGFHGELGEHSMQSLWAVGEGLLYQIEGDPAYAEQAAEYVWEGMFGVLPNKNQWRQSYRILGVALAYDLCYDAWDPAFRKVVYHYLLRQACLYNDRADLLDVLGTGGRFPYGSEAEPAAPGRTGPDPLRYRLAGGLAALALLPESPAFYEPPSLATLRTVEPDRSFTPVLGLPIVQLREGHMFRDWIANGPFPAGWKADPLEEIGGLAKARPQPGTLIAVNGVELDFRRYHPAGRDDPVKGPRLYPRDCMRYFTKSTGNGYAPGLRVMNEANAAAGRRVGTELVWYTIWHNEDDRMVQCFPNRFWQSRGVRMWVNGVEVRDDEIIRVLPGYYPVMVLVPVTGGYANQAPHFRSYTPAQNQRELAAIAQARALLGDPAEALRGMAEHAAKDLRRYLSTELDASGWQSWTLPEHLWPFVLAYQRVWGEDLVADSPVTAIAAIATSIHDMFERYPSRYQLHAAAPFLKGADAAVARWFRAHFPLNSGRPSDSVYMLATLDPSAPRRSAEEVFGNHPVVGENVLNFFARRDDQGGNRFLAALIGAGPEAKNPHIAHSLLLAGERRSRNQANDWVSFAGHDALSAMELSSAPRLSGLFNLGPTEVLHYDAKPDGSGSVTLSTRLLHHGEVLMDSNGRRSFNPGDAASSAIRIQRSLLVDYSGDCGAPALFVVADHFRNVGRHMEKSTQFWSGIDFRGIDWIPREGRMLKKERDADGTVSMQMRILAPRPIKGIRTAHNTEGTRGTYRFVMDVQETHDQKLRSSDRRLLLDGERSDLVLEFEDELIHESRQAQVENVTILSVFTICAGTEHPPVSGSEYEVKVGDLTIRFDGTRLERQ